MCFMPAVAGHEDGSARRLPGIGSEPIVAVSAVRGKNIMRSRNAIFAAILAMAPFSAKSADLVVWWEQGFYPEEDKAVRETIAAFEHKTGKQVELVFHEQADLPDKVQAAIAAGQPPDFLFGILIDPNIAPWAYDDRLVDLTEAIGPLSRAGGRRGDRADQTDPERVSAPPSRSGAVLLAARPGPQSGPVMARR
jgi:hypothetical protein